jgi:hypothetical protein
MVDMSKEGIDEQNRDLEVDLRRGVEAGNMAEQLPSEEDDR